LLSLPAPRADHDAQSEKVAKSARLTFDLGAKSAVQTGSLRIDGSYGIFVQGFNRLRQSIKISVAGRDFAREPIEPFAAPSDTPKAGGAGGGAAVLAIGNGSTPVTNAIISLETIRDLGLSVVDTAYAMGPNQPVDYTELNAVRDSLASKVNEYIKINQFSPTTRPSVAIVSAVRQTFSKIKTLSGLSELQLTAQQSLVAKESEYVSFAEGVSKVLDMIQSQTLDKLSEGPFQAKNDVISVTITSRDIAKDGTVSTEESAFNHDFEVNSGFKIDFSAGLLVTKLDDIAYRATALGTNPETYKVVGSDTGGAIKSAAFIHFRGLFNTSQNYGLSAGISLDERPYYAIGLSLHSSSTRQRLVLTGGIAFRSVVRYEGPSTISTTDFTTTMKFKNSLFIALSYNF
jgi:hypothetical protein